MVNKFPYGKAAVSGVLRTVNGKTFCASDCRRIAARCFGIKVWGCIPNPIADMAACPVASAAGECKSAGFPPRSGCARTFAMCHRRSRHRPAGGSLACLKCCGIRLWGAAPNPARAFALDPLPLRRGQHEARGFPRASSLCLPCKTMLYCLTLSRIANSTVRS